MNQKAGTGTTSLAEVLITAEEAYPAMEREFLAARREIWAGYRVFDLSTKLRSDAARAIGDDWFDLVLHTLKRGVALHIVLSDFDPIFADDLHRMAWKAKRAFIAAGELAGPEAKLEVLAATHSARVGLLPRLAFWPFAVKKLRDHAEAFNAMSPDRRARTLETSPGLAALLHTGRDGRLVPRRRPAPPLFPGTHHQKLAVFDRKRLCIGGLDLDERRYDDKGHHRRRDQTWHDVQLMMEGPVAEEAESHLETFLDVVAGRGDAPSPGPLLTTLSRRRRQDLTHLSPKPVSTTLAAAHRDQFARAERLIYLETQFFRDKALAEALAGAARDNPALTLILIVPGAPEDVAFEGNEGFDARFGEYQQARAIDIVRAAFGDRATICSPVRPVEGEGSGRDTLCGAPIVYVHAKVAIFDEARAIVSSANLNGRSLAWDTEAGVLLDQPPAVADLKRRVFDHWLGAHNGALFHDPASAAGEWAKRATANAALAPPERDGFLVPYDEEAPRAFGRRLPFVPDAMV